MAIRSRNVALEGLASEYFSALDLALLGFLAYEDVPVVDEAPAQADDIEVHVTAMAASGGGTHGRAPPLPRQPIRRPQGWRPLRADIVEEAPAQRDDVAAVVRETLAPAVVAAAVETVAPVRRRRPRRVVVAAAAPVVAARCAGGSPAQRDEAAVRILLRSVAAGEMPAQADDGDAVAFRVRSGSGRGAVRERPQRLVAGRRRAA